MRRDCHRRPVALLPGLLGDHRDVRRAVHDQSHALRVARRTLRVARSLCARYAVRIRHVAHDHSTHDQSVDVARTLDVRLLGRQTLAGHGRRQTRAERDRQTNGSRGHHRMGAIHDLRTDAARDHQTLGDGLHGLRSPH